MKRNLKLFALLVVVAAFFTGCKWCPEGNPSDYKKLEKRVYEYDLSSGTGYYGKGYLGTSSVSFGNSGDTYTFKAKEDMTIKYSERLYKSEESKIEVRKWDGETVTYDVIKKQGGKSIKDKSFSVNAGDEIKVTFYTLMYATKSGVEAWEFYLWAK
jgi:hypothetical protein